MMPLIKYGFVEKEIDIERFIHKEIKYEISNLETISSLFLFKTFNL